MLQSDDVTMADQFRSLGLSYNTIKNVINALIERYSYSLDGFLTVCIDVPVNQPQVVVVLVQVGCNLEENKK